MDFLAIGLTEAHDQDAVMRCRPILGEAFVRGDQRAGLGDCERPESSVRQSLVRSAAYVFYVVAKGV
jgi:hypothetical protein